MKRDGCQHPTVAEIRTEGGDLLTWQCTLCLEIISPCDVCEQALSPRHREVSEGCTMCRKGRFCNSRTSLCEMCAPAQDGVCVGCKKPFPQTGRQKKCGKVYCGRVCLDRAYRDRKASKLEALPVATEVADAP